MLRTLLFLLLAGAMAAGAQTVRVLKASEAREFRMGKVTSLRMVHPEMGARRITLNFSASEDGHEFAQHVHDGSDDTIVVLEGRADLRQGDSRHSFAAGQSAYVPAGQIHGTITTANGTRMISFQTPPDLALYTGARDSSKPGAAPPKGAITPGAVRYVPFADRNGLFVHPGMGAMRIAAGHRRLAPGETFTQVVPAGAEVVVFVWRGSVAVLPGGGQTAGEKDAVFAAGPARLELKNASAGEATIIHAQSPPPPTR